MTHSRLFGGLLLVCIFSLTPVQSIAAEAGSVHIKDVNLTQNGRDIQAVFSVQNLSSETETIKYGVRLQEKSGTDVHEVVAGEVSLAAGESRIEYAALVLPPTMQGLHDAFIISRDSAGLVITLKYAGQVDIPSAHTSPEPKLANCEVDVDDIVCDIAGAQETTASIHYIVNEGSIYAPTLTEGVVNEVDVIGESVSVQVSDALVDGSYMYRLWLADEALAQSVVVQIPPGEVATSTTDQVISSTAQSGKKYEYTKFLVIVTPVVLLFLLLYIAIRRPKTLLVVIFGLSISSAGIVAASVVLRDTNSYAHIFNALSQDSGQQQFVISLDKTKFQNIEPVTFSVVFQNTALPNTKPAGGSIDMRVDRGSWRSLVTSSYSSAVSHHTISAISTVGTHTLYFRSPGLCGGAFSRSLFNTGIFGTTECTFSMPVTIVPNDPPTLPIIGGNCTIAEPCNIGIVSTDTDGGRLCYQAQWPRGGTSNAGCATEGTPVSAQYTFNSCSASDTTVRARATDAKGQRSSWGVGSSIIPGTINCIQPCSYCTYNGTRGDVAISATPAFLPKTRRVNISWDLTNVKTCSVEGVDLDTGARIDYWPWGQVRLADNKQSSLLNGVAKYTISCTDLDSNAKSASVTIKTLPNWQEF